MDARHEPIARAGAEPRTDVETGGDREQCEASGEEQHLCPQLVLHRDQEQPELRTRADQRHVQDRSEARFLTDRYPEHQHEQADDVGDETERDAGLLRDTLREHIPGGDTDARLHHHRDGDAIDEQPDEKLGDSVGHHERCGHRDIQP